MAHIRFYSNQASILNSFLINLSLSLCFFLRFSFVTFSCHCGAPVLVFRLFFVFLLISGHLQMFPVVFCGGGSLETLCFGTGRLVFLFTPHGLFNPQPLFRLNRNKTFFSLCHSVHFSTLVQL